MFNSLGMSHMEQGLPDSWAASRLARTEQTLHIAVNTSRPKVSYLTSASASLLCCLETQTHEHTYVNARTHTFYAWKSLLNLYMYTHSML